MIRLFASRRPCFVLYTGFLSLFFLTGAPMAFGAMQMAGGLVPPQMTLPIPWGVLKVLLLVTFWIHIILVNIVIGSVFLATVHAWRTPVGASYPMKRDISLVPGLLALAVNFGVAPFLFIQVAYGSFIYSSGVLMAIWWLCVPLLVIFCYYALYMAKAGLPDNTQSRRFFLTLLTLMLCTIAFMLSTNVSLMLRPESWFRWFAQPGGNMLNLSDPTFIPRYLHMITASVAIGGIFMAIRAKWKLRWPKTDRQSAGKNIKEGLDWFFKASLIQPFLGLWFLLALPTGVMKLFIGFDLFATFAFLLALTTFAAALWSAWTGSVWRTTIFTAGLVFIMISIRDIVRDSLLAPFMNGAPRSVVGDSGIFDALHGTAAELPLPVAQGQAGAFAFFLFCALIGVVICIWLARLSIRLFSGNETASYPLSGQAEE